MAEISAVLGGDDPSSFSTTSALGNGKGDTLSIETLTSASAVAAQSTAQSTVDGVPGFASPTSSTGLTSGALSTTGFSSTSSHASSTASAAAASTSASLTSNSTSNSSSNDGFSAGAVAGIAIGAAAGAALLSFLITFFLCGRRGRSRRTQARNLPDAGFSEKDNHMAGAAAWQAFLPQAADDEALRNGAKTLFDQIELHVDNFYSAKGTKWNANTSQSVRRMDSGKLPASIEELMQTPRLTLAVIKHCIAYDLILSISPSARPESSLLPAKLAILPARLQNGTNNRSRDDRVARQAYGQYKLLNSFLFPEAKTDAAYKMDRDVSTSDAADALCNVFLPWQSPAQRTEDIKQNAKGLANTAADLGVLIMSQASMYEFGWTAGNPRSTREGALVTFPGFSKTADEQGRKVEPVQVLLPPDVVWM